MSDLDEVVGEFLIESNENLDQLDEDLVALERDPGDREILASVFRTMHTLKGTCGFLGFSGLERIAHVAENLLGKLRDGDLDVTPEITTALLQAGDAARAALASIERTGSEGEADHEDLVATLERLRDGSGDSGGPSGHAHAVADGDAAVAPTVAPGDGQPTEDDDGQASASTVAQSSIRVDVRLLDQLMNLVGELVLARNQMLQLGETFDEVSFTGATQRLNLITSELQEGVMKTRMQPISTVWSRFPRVVRDLSSACGKRVGVKMEGEETELDKTIIEAIKDPLTHLVRNAVDHGLESGAAREESGKPAEGLLTLRAFHEGGQVNVEVSDDGAGIDPDAVRAKAVERALISAEQAAALGDRDAINLIFEPGFSTAASVTSVSGRGVGMDVVRTNVERIGGTVDVHSQPGSGTTFRVKIPLTLAIIPALIVTCAGERYAIPQVGLLELVRLEGEQAASGIELIHSTPVYRLRGRLLPVVELDAELGLAPARGAGEREALNIVVLQTEGQSFGLVVDEVNDTQEIVVKPLGKQVRDVDTFAGATIMGDGRVALILDVSGIAARAGLTGERDGLEALGGTHADLDASGQRRMLLVAGLEGDRRAAIPLAQVARLESFPQTAVERTGAHEVVQYRGGMLPLVRLSGMLGPGAAFGGGAGERLDGGDPHALEVVVHTRDGRDVGIVVDRILDIVEEPTEAEDGRALDGSMVVGGRVTDLVDVAGLVEGVAADLPAPAATGVAS